MNVKSLRACWKIFRDIILEIQSKCEKHKMAKEKQKPEYSKFSTEMKKMKNAERSEDIFTKYFIFTKSVFSSEYKGYE